MPSGSARRRRRSRRRSSRGTPTSSPASSSVCSPRRRRRPEESSGSRSRGCGSPARRGSSTASSQSARTRSRTRCSPRESRGTARSCRFGRPRRGSPSSRATPTAVRSAPQCWTSSSSFNDERRDLLGERNALESDVTGIAQPIARNEAEKAVSLRPILDAVDRARVESTPAFTPQRQRWLDRLLGPDREHDARASRTWPGSGGCRPWSRRTRRSGASRSASRRCARSASTSQSEKGIRPDLEDRPQKSPRACVIAVRPAARRPPHHPCAGWPARLRGIPPRGRPRAPLRRLRAVAAALVPEAVARSLPHRDLLVPARLDHVRARMACGALRAGRRGGPAERGRRALLEHPALPPLLGEARLRARLLGPLPVGRRDAGRLRGAADRRDGDPLPGGEPPRRHGRRLLLGRLPPRVDPRRAGTRPPAPRGGRGLVAAGRRPAPSCATSSARARGRRPRRSRSGSASIRSTLRRSLPR